MLVTWMAYATLLAATVSVAALAIERIVAIWGGARRAVWLGALAAAIGIPIWLATGARAPGRVVTPSPEISRVTIDGSVFASPPGTIGRTSLATVRQFVATGEGVASRVWLAASLLLLGVFLRAGAMLCGRRAEWRTATVDGYDVLVARDVGPAVVGAWRPRIVFPEWALGLERHDRMLMLKHESEHVSAGDPALLLAASLAIVCLPWNAGVWFIVRRLRLAVEIDCDARVLRAMNHPREYGMLLLAVGARHATRLPFAASLAERRPLLEQRIRAMTSIRPTHPVIASIALGAVVVVTTTLAAQAPRPEPLIVGGTRVADAKSAVLRDIDVPTLAALAPKRDSVRVHGVRADSVRVQNDVELQKNREQHAPTSGSGSAPRGATVQATGMTPISSTSGSASPAKGDIPFEVLRAWIAKYHPKIVTGQATAALVTIIVDANDGYVSSTTDATPASPNAARKLPVDSIAQIEVLKGAAAEAVYGSGAVNGVITIRTKRAVTPSSQSEADSTLTRRAMNNNIDGKPLGLTQFQSQIGPRPLYVIDGVVVDSPDPIANPTDQLEKLGVSSDGIQSVQVLRVGAGRVGPNALSVVVVKLKP